MDKEMTNSEIWDGWCGNASPKSDEGHFDSIEDVRAYVADRMQDWGNESLTPDIDDDGNETERTVSDMTEDEIEAVVNGIWGYFQDNQ
jgi:hypothetical protein